MICQSLSLCLTCPLAGRGLQRGSPSLLVLFRQDIHLSDFRNSRARPLPMVHLVK